MNSFEESGTSFARLPTGIAGFDAITGGGRPCHELLFWLAGRAVETGYSSLSYLKKLPISKLKINKSFIKDIAEAQGQPTGFEGLGGRLH